MVDLKILEERGLTQENLKKWLHKDLHNYPANHGYAPESQDSDEGRRAMMVNRIARRVQEGRDRNLTNYRVYAAINECWNTPFKQINPSMVRALLDSDPNDSSVQDQVRQLGMEFSEVISVTDDPKSAGKKVARFNAPAFYKVVVPLARSMATVRWASIVNNRMVVPFLKAEPSVSTALNRLRGEVLTGAFEDMNRWYDYQTDYKQSALYMLKYGISIELPESEWNTELQETQDETLARKDAENVILLDESNRMTRLVKQGLKYFHPHPTRCFWDRSHGLSSFNTDSGCDHFGYWKIKRMRDIRYNPAYWNTDQVSVGAGAYWWQGAGAFFNMVYGGCAMNWPSFSTSGSDNDRETKLLFNTYSRDYDDMSVQVTEYFEKLIPKDNGLGDYEYPVWMRFVLAGDNTILYAAPLPYCPVLYAGYDSDEYEDQNSSMVLEAMPLQDLFSNTLTQHMYSIRQNLANLTFIDEEATPDKDKTWLDQIKGLGEKMIRGLNIFTFSSQKWRRAGINNREIVQSFTFPKLNTQESIQALKLIMDMLERVLVMSSQELAQQATHEQTREEVRHIATSTSNRLQFTSSAMDRMMEAKKIQLYQALMAYGEDEMYAQVPTGSDVTPELLAELGFTVEEAPSEPTSNTKPQNYQKIRKSSLKLPYVSFVANRDGQDRFDNVQGGQAMMQFLGTVVRDPNFVSATGMQQILELTNMAIEQLGFPRDFRLKFTGQTPQAQQQELQGVIAQMQQAMDQRMQESEQKVGDLEKNSKETEKLLLDVTKELVEVERKMNGQ